MSIRTDRHHLRVLIASGLLLVLAQHAAAGASPDRSEHDLRPR